MSEVWGWTMHTVFCTFSDALITFSMTEVSVQLVNLIGFFLCGAWLMNICIIWSFSVIFAI